MTQPKPEAAPQYRVTDRGRIQRPTQVFMPGDLMSLDKSDQWLVEQGYVEPVTAEG